MRNCVKQEIRPRESPGSQYSFYPRISTASPRVSRNCSLKTGDYYCRYSSSFFAPLPYFIESKTVTLKMFSVDSEEYKYPAISHSLTSSLPHHHHHQDLPQQSPKHIHHHRSTYPNLPASNFEPSHLTIPFITMCLWERTRYNACGHTTEIIVNTCSSNPGCYDQRYIRDVYGHGVCPGCYFR